MLAFGGGGEFIPRRDTSSALNTMVGGRLFPGMHHRARFDVPENGDHVAVDLRSLDGIEHEWLAHESLCA